MTKKIIALAMACLMLSNAACAEGIQKKTAGILKIKESGIVRIDKDYNCYLDLSSNKSGSNEIFSEPFAKLKCENNLLLVNDDNALDRNYTVNGLVDILDFKKSLEKVNAGIYCKGNSKLEKPALDGFINMLQGAKQGGIDGYLFRSGYRSFKTQKVYFDARVKLYNQKMSYAEAYKQASRIIAVPGTSEHNMGLAIDLCQKGGGLVPAFEKTRQYKWLLENSYKYGFIVRYPKDKTSITNKIYEPWHIRYIGTPHAELAAREKLCMEEYIDFVKNAGAVGYRLESGTYILIYVSKEAYDKGNLTITGDKPVDIRMSVADKKGRIVTIKVGQGDL